MNLLAMLHNLLEVLIAGLVLGAGLPALFALGIRFAAPVDEVDENGTVISTHPASGLQRAIGYFFFSIIVLAIIVGILWITKAVIYEDLGIDIFGTQAGGGHGGH
ncbi:hypothetical protein [Corynebacterium aquilae]|uniref:Uncharacterized protein n=1 Tax=Corynebacterium aquilae DSM 44791 TaxID=1431546 RepID=A0A1L7CDQ0_9CORY|nr:hypothetical protein [Corynebacterium aquilae]APT83966.1 hypothetical protein CAQU_01515 [Corynebacterium aquilae DSM 44791]